MVILRHVHLRKIGEFDEKVILLERKTSAVVATAFAFFKLTDNDKVKRALIGLSITEILISKHRLLHDFDHYFQEKMLLELSTFFTRWRSLAAKPSELLASN